MMSRDSTVEYATAENQVYNVVTLPNDHDQSFHTRDVSFTGPPSKKRNTRVSQACDRCRQLKAKCDETRPCKACRDKGTECRYGEATPKDTDKTLADIRKVVFDMKEMLARLINDKHSIDSRLNQLEWLSNGRVLNIKIDTEPSISHATRTSQFLGWPGIKSLMSHHLRNAGVSSVREFPVILEQKRELLLVNGTAKASSPAQCEDPGSDGCIADYVESFKANILNMHPLIQPLYLDQWVVKFLRSLPSADICSARQSDDVATATTANEYAGSKRKRPSWPEGISEGSRLPRDIDDALVLIVIALGKLCLYKSQIPDTAQSVELTLNCNPPSRGQTSWSGQASAGQSSMMGQWSGSQSSLKPGPINSTQKDVESIPGLKYLALAISILGDYQGSYNNVTEVYCRIFAALYYDQLNRPLESFASISLAGQKLQVLMRPSLNTMKKIKHGTGLIKNHSHNQLALTFWTCLQLESDLVTELPLPPSGVQQFENDMPFPNPKLLRGFNQAVINSYFSHLHSQRYWHSIYLMFNAPQNSNKPGKDKLMEFSFSGKNPPAGDILEARLRARYWDVQVIEYVPFIRQILQFSDGMMNSSLRSSETPGYEWHSDIDHELVDLAKKGIHALIESTRAFHGLGEKQPIITNNFGTAHAQWGNLLVLSAAYRDPVLRQYVPEITLQNLFDRMILFLRQSAATTSSLWIDKNVLESLYKDLFIS